MFMVFYIIGLFDLRSKMLMHRKETGADVE